jgi:hypothetical protein
MFNIFTEKATRRNLELFADQMQQISRQIGFKVSARGWAYLLEGQRLINKDQFDRVETVINSCRKKGILPIDFVAEEEGRQFSGVEVPTSDSPCEYLKRFLDYPLSCHRYYTPDWWEDEEYYIQMLVEKIDLKTLFEPVCEKYHIPIATSKGWSSMLQRAQYARRFQEAEEKGLQCVLLYAGDHDPDGLRISDFIRSNLDEIKNIEWENGDPGYDPANLEIRRFGLEYDFIVKHKLTWIDNLITGSGKNLASPNHKNHSMSYVQDYLKTIGERKCEANAIVIMPDVARRLVENVIIEYLGKDALNRFQLKRDEIRDQMDDIREKTGLTKVIKKAIQFIDKIENDEEE